METKDIKVKRHMNLIPLDYHVVRGSSSGAIRRMWSTIDMCLDEFLRLHLGPNVAIIHNACISFESLDSFWNICPQYDIYQPGMMDERLITAER